MKKLITADDITAIVSVTDPQYAPDGTRAAYVKSQVNQEKIRIHQIYGSMKRKRAGLFLGHMEKSEAPTQDGLRTGARLPLFLIEKAMRHSCI